MKVIVNENSLKTIVNLLKEDSSADNVMDDNIAMSGTTQPDTEDDKYDIRKNDLIKQAKDFVDLFNDIKTNKYKKEDKEGNEISMDLSDDDILDKIRKMYKSSDKLSMVLNQDDPLKFANLVLNDEKFADSVAQTKLIQKKKADDTQETTDINETYKKIKERIPEIFNKSYKSLTFYELAMIMRKIQREFAGDKNVSEFLEHIVSRTKDLMTNKYREAADRIKHYTIYSEDKHAQNEMKKVGILVYSFKTAGKNGQEIMRMYVGTNGELTAVAKELPGQRIISMDLHGLPKKNK